MCIGGSSHHILNIMLHVLYKTTEISEISNMFDILRCLIYPDSLLNSTLYVLGI